MTRSIAFTACMATLLGACAADTSHHSHTHADVSRGADGDLSSVVRNDDGDDLLDVTWDAARKVLVYRLPGRSPIEMPFPDIEGAPTEETIDVTSQYIYGQVHAYHDSPGCDIGSHGQTSCTTSCCQDHDECYHREGCTSSSWLGSSPSDTPEQRARDEGRECGSCNLNVTGCFLNPLCHTQALGCYIGGDGPMRSECGCQQSCYSTTAGRYCTDSCQNDAQPDHMCMEGETSGCTYSPPVTPRHCEDDPSAAGCPNASNDDADAGTDDEADAGTDQEDPDGGVDQQNPDDDAGMDQQNPDDPDGGTNQQDPGGDDAGTNDPPSNAPPSNDPPSNDPPANDPPANDPPANDPPANDPPADDGSGGCGDDCA